MPERNSKGKGLELLPQAIVLGAPQEGRRPDTLDRLPERLSGSMGLKPLRLDLCRDIDMAGHGFIQLIDIEFPLPTADNDRRNAISDQISQGAALAHELVDTEQDGQRCNRDIRKDLQGCRQRHETCPRYT